MGAPCHVCDLPDALLEVILRFCTATDRAAASRSGSMFRRVHNECQWTFMRCSMHLLVSRGRYDDIPHWTADLVRFNQTLRRHTFERLQHLVVLLDTPCFSRGRSPWVHVEHRTRLLHPHLRTLYITSTRRNFSKPEPRALCRIIESFPNVTFLSLAHVRSVDSNVLHLILQKSRPLRNLILRECHFTQNAHRSLTLHLATDPDWEDVLNLAWPSSLTSLEMSGHTVRQIIRTTTRLLHEHPLNLPRKLRYLDLGDAIAQLRDYQLVVSVAVLTWLEELVVSVRCEHAINVLELYKPRIFPDLALRFLL